MIDTKAITAQFEETMKEHIEFTAQLAMADLQATKDAQMIWLNYDAERLWKIKQDIKALQEQEKLISETLKLAANGKSAVFGDFMYLLKKRKGSVKYGEIPELQGIDLEQYRSAEITYFELIKP